MFLILFYTMQLRLFVRMNMCQSGGSPTPLLLSFKTKTLMSYPLLQFKRLTPPHPWVYFPPPSLLINALIFSPPTEFFQALADEHRRILTPPVHYITAVYCSILQYHI